MKLVHYLSLILLLLASPTLLASVPVSIDTDGGSLPDSRDTDDDVDGAAADAAAVNVEVKGVAASAAAAAIDGEEDDGPAGGGEEEEGDAALLLLLLLVVLLVVDQLSARGRAPVPCARRCACARRSRAVWCRGRA